MKALRLLLILFTCFYTLNAFAEQKLTLLLDWFPNPDQAPVFIAQEKGFFAQQGLKVNIIAPANADDPPKMVAAGKADLAISYQPQLVLSAAQGLPLVRIATLIDHPLGCLLAQKNITQLKDLNGKTIGYSAAGVDEAMVNAMLQSVKLSTKNVTMINVNYDLVQALLLHRVDAITGVLRNFELLELQQQHFPFQVFYPEKYGIPTYDEFIIVTNKKLLHDPRLPKFLTALQEGRDYLIQHPKQSWELFASHYPAANNALNHQSWFITLPNFAANVRLLNKTRYTQFADFMYQQHLIKSIPLLENYAVVLPSLQNNHEKS